MGLDPSCVLCISLPRSSVKLSTGVACLGAEAPTCKPKTSEVGQNSAHSELRSEVALEATLYKIRRRWQLRQNQTLANHEVGGACVETSTTYT